MKKKLFVISLVAVVLICIFSMTACKDQESGDYDGTYYLTFNGYTDKSDYIVISGDKWSNSRNLKGKFEVKNGKIDFYLEAFGQSEFLYSGTIKDGLIKLDELGDNFYYCHESLISSGEDNVQEDEGIKVELNVNGGEKLTSDTFDIDNETSYILPIPVRSGYIFEGWYYGDIKMSNEYGQSLKSAKRMNGQVLTAHWKARTYRVMLSNLNPSLGELDGSGFYDCDSAVKISAKPILGYDFVGWYDESNALISNQKEYTFTIKGNREFTAQWRIREDITPFEFVSSKTSCIITGIKDKSATSIEVPSYVTDINMGAFSGCKSVESLTVPFVGITDNDEEIKIGFLGMLFDVSAINNAVVPSSLKSVIVNGSCVIRQDAFKNCGNLASVRIAGKVIAIEKNAFGNCAALEQVEIGIGVKEIDNNAFIGCNNATFKCEAVKKPNGWAESWIPADATVTWEYNKVTTNYAYDYVVDDGKAYLVQYKGNSVNVVIPNYVDGNEVVYLGTIFENTNIKTVTIPQSVEEIENAIFDSCEVLESISVIAGNSTYNSRNGILYYLDMKEILCIPKALKGDVVIPDTVTAIEENAFENRNNLSSVEIPLSVTAIGKHAFKGNTDLIIYCAAESKPDDWDDDWNSYHAPVVWNHKLHGVTNEGTKWGLTNDNKITITRYVYGADQGRVPERINGYTVTAIADRSIPYCASINLPYGISSIGEYAFERSYSLQSIKVDARNKYFSDQGGILYDKAKTEIVHVPRAIEGKVEIADSVTEIDNDAFKFCSNITGVSFGPESKLVKIGEYAFSRCRNLICINIPDTVIEICNGAFWGCTNLIRICIPNSVVVIGSLAFSSCDNLTIYCQASEKPSGWYSAWNYSDRPVVWGYEE